jgi:flagellar hook-basal body protein
MYAAVTGLSALSTGMQVISNNIANVNTVGFKAARTNFEDLISQDYWSNGKINQIGRGVKVSSVQQMFTQGAFINSAQDTDMAIAGEGFFMVRDRVTNELMYTRAGNFTFDKDGLLETPAGYVLQGWEMSIPKPGADPVKIGVPTDVKVIMLNAPPVETSQIKVVVNLNADDNSAYIYSSAEFAELYAFQVADGPAQSARLAAEHLVYDYASGGSAYVNSYDAFNSAYLAFMSAHGFYPVSPGSTDFTRIEYLHPSLSARNSAQNAAAASARAAITIIDPDYPLEANSTIFESAYNSAFVKFMSAKGYKEIAAGVFKSVNGKLATVQETNLAKSYAVESAKNHGFPTYTAFGNWSNPGDSLYVSAYTEYMESLGFTSPVPDYYSTPPSTAEYTAASDAASALATVVFGGTYPGFPSSNDEADLVYAAELVKRMSAAGYKVDTATLTATTFPDTDPSSLVSTLADDALTSARDRFSNPLYVYDQAGEQASGLLYLAMYLRNVPEAIQLDPSSTWITDNIPATMPPDVIPDAPPLTQAELDDAHAAGLEEAKKADPSLTSYTYPDGSPAVRMAYLAGYSGYLATLTPPRTIGTLPNPLALPAAVPAAADFVISDKLSGLAHAAGKAAAGKDYDGAAQEDYDTDLLYVAAWTEYIRTNGNGLQISSPYTGTVPDITQAEFNRGITNAEKNNAHTSAMASANAAVTNLTPPPTGYPSRDDAWNAAYLASYKSHLPAGAESRLSLGSSVPPSAFRSFVPLPAEVTAADTSAMAVAWTAVGPFTGYPSASKEQIVADAYNVAYENQMASRGFSLVGPPDYFEKSAVVSATSADIKTAEAAARAAAELKALNAGQAAYDAVYNFLYASALSAVSLLVPEKWKLEGMGFAGAWDGTDLESPIDPENYTHANPWTIYDSLGTAHTLMVYYQPNPYMENVWDYIITCDPTEDARKDVNNSVVMNGASFAGLIQKGKITFTADGPDRHGGQIKDIEAQNINMSATALAALSSGATVVQNPATSSSMSHFRFGGYYTGSPVFSATTGTLVASQRTYTIVWKGNLGTVPDVSGFTWSDGVHSGTIPVYDKNYTGPYPFGSGLSISFHDGGTPMRFTVNDQVQVTAHSEAIGWDNISANSAGYFDFDVAFVQSASLALHPPYPPGLPTIIQHIAVDMGARYANPADEDADRWILDEQSTTQYADKSLNIFSSQDGYPPGSLQRVSIDKDGILTGIYTNGRHQPLYQIGLTRFLNPWGLAKLGDNVYMETRWSGVGVTNPPGYGGTGTIRANFLEQSNTDIADEIVNMIVTQRGFQANSKVVTTTDTMLAEVIEMKR